MTVGQSVKKGSGWGVMFSPVCLFLNNTATELGGAVFIDSPLLDIQLVPISVRRMQQQPAGGVRLTQGRCRCDAMDWTLDRAVGTVRASDDDRQYGRSWSRIDWMECGSATSNVDMLWMHVPRQYCIVSNSTRLWLRSLSLTHTQTHTHIHTHTHTHTHTLTQSVLRFSLLDLSIGGLHNSTSVVAVRKQPMSSVRRLWVLFRCDDAI